MIPISDLQFIFEMYYSMEKKDPDKFAKIMKPNHTIEASLFEDALKAEAITNEEFIDSSFCVTVDFGKTPHKDCCFVPVLMCVGEGSQEDLRKGLALLVGKGS